MRTGLIEWAVAEWTRPGQTDFSNARLSQQDPPPMLADYILPRWGKQNDDALVLVVRYLGLAT